MALRSTLAGFKRLLGWQTKPTTPPPFPTVKSVIACHFFGDHASYGFWDDQQLDRVPDLLNIIRNDGFNTIILVVPFEPFIEMQPGTRLNSWYWERLRIVLEMAAQARLAVILRLGNSHSTSPDNSAHIVARQLQWLNEVPTRLWLEVYFQKVADVVKDADVYVGSFLAWEDFWIIFEHPTSLDAEKRVTIAQQANLAEHAKSWGDAEQLHNLLGNEPQSWPTHIIPSPGTPAYVLWMKWFDRFFLEFVGSCARAHIPDVGFEVRSDGHPITINGQTTWATFDMLQTSSARRYGYWGAFYGATNNGERVSATDALRSLNYYLDVMNGEGKAANLVLEQFNIVDNTLVFSGANARIADDQVTDFLQLAAQVLAKRTAGYGLWTYRNYRENWLSNSAFQRRLDGWRSEGNVQIIDTGALSQHWLLMSQESKVEQQIHGILRMQAALQSYPPFNILIHARSHPHDVTSEAPTHAAFVITVGGIAATPNGYEAGRLRFSIPHEAMSVDKFNFSLQHIGPSMVTITDLCLFAYEQLGGLYDANHTELPMASLIREFNNAINNSVAKQTLQLTTTTSTRGGEHANVGGT
jgi:hypothetical protein